jgi:hypothetical protein
VTTGSQQFQRFRFVASGGETTISGADANGAVLAYTAGLEQVVLNGAVLVRGHDYTATTGTTITGLSPALVASDVLEVFSFIAFTVANTYTQSQVDGLLDSYVGLRLITPSSVVGGTIGATGAVTFSGASSVSLNGCFTSSYTNYKVVIQNTNSASCGNSIRLRANGSDLSTSVYNHALFRFRSGNSSGADATPGEGVTSAFYSADSGDDGQNYYTLEVSNPQVSANTNIIVHGVKGISTAGFIAMGAFGGIRIRDNFQADGFTVFPESSRTMTGTVRVYGYKN